MDSARLDYILNRLATLRLAVVGDYFLDRYLDIDQRLTEVSLETGLEAHQVVRIRNSPGAAGNAAANIATLGPKVLAVSVIGDDGQGHDLVRALEAQGIDTTSLIRSPERFTPTYTKPMLCEPDGSARELSRLDIKNRTPLPHVLEREIISRLDRLVPEVDGVVIVDQVQERNCGAITDLVRAALQEHAARHPSLPFLVDSRMRVGEYQGISLKPNDREALTALDPTRNASASRLAEAEAAGCALYGRTGRPVYVTVGAEGILVCEADGCTRVPAVPVTGEIDIVGAGDSTMAGIASALCAGSTPTEAALVGNLVASVTIRCIGTTGTARPSQVQAALCGWARAHGASVA